MNQKNRTILLLLLSVLFCAFGFLFLFLAILEGAEGKVYLIPAIGFILVSNLLNILNRHLRKHRDD